MRSVLALMILLLISGNAWSHAALTKSVPRNRDVVSQSPARLQLHFNEQVEAKFSTVSIEDDAGVKRALDAPALAAEDPQQLEVRVAQTLEPGHYTVRYRVLSKDGHVIERSYAFTIKAAKAADTAP